jgi:hypothetical protein
MTTENNAVVVDASQLKSPHLSSTTVGTTGVPICDDSDGPASDDEY